MIYNRQTIFSAVYEVASWGSWGVGTGRNLEVEGGVGGLSRDEQNKPKRMQNTVFLILIDRACIFETLS